MNWKIATVSFVSFFNSLIAITCFEPIVLSDLSEDGKMPSVAINGRGDAAVAWIGVQKFQAGIRTAEKLSQGSWSCPEIVSEENINPPRCFLSDQGGLHVLWKRWICDEAKHVQKMLGKAWTDPVCLNVNMQRYSNFVFDGNGEFLFLHDKNEDVFFVGRTTTAEVHIKRPEQSEEDVFTPPGAMHGWFGQPRYSYGEMIGSNSLGDIFVIWRRKLDCIDSFYQGSWLHSDGSFSDTEELLARTGFLDAFLSGIAIDAQKNIVVAGVKKNRVQVFSRIDGQWSDWTPLSEENKKKGTCFMPRPQVAVDGQGNVLVVWKTETETETYIEAAYKGFQQDWLALEKITLEGKVGRILLRSDHKENFIVLWEEMKDRKHSGLYAAEFSDHERTWPSIFPLSPEEEFCAEPSLEFSQNGKGILAWTKKTSSFESCIEAMEFSLGQ